MGDRFGHMNTLTFDITLPNFVFYGARVVFIVAELFY